MLLLDVENRKILGVAAGFARSWHMDVFIVRVLFVIGLFLSLGTGLLVYLTAWCLMPTSPSAPKLAGVCVQLNRHFGWSEDPLLFRVVALFIVSSSVGIGLLFYFLVAIMLPRDTDEDDSDVASVRDGE